MNRLPAKVQMRVALGPAQIRAHLSNILGIRNVHAQSPQSTFLYEARTWHWEELTVFHAVGNSTPQNPF